MLPVIGQFRPWTDPAVTGIGRLPMHVPLACADRRSLDGSWSFALYDHPDSVPEAAITGDAPTTTVTVCFPSSSNGQLGRCSQARTP